MTRLIDKGHKINFSQRSAGMGKSADGDVEGRFVLWLFRSKASGGLLPLESINRGNRRDICKLVD